MRLISWTRHSPRAQRAIGLSFDLRLATARVAFPALLVAGVSLLASSATACRLDHSRIAALSLSQQARVYGASVIAERSAFALGSRKGDYTRWMTRIDLFVGTRTMVSAEMSYLELSTIKDGSQQPATSGLGNPLVSARHVASLWHGGSVSLGVQAELPAGDRNQGIAGDHLEVMPHLGIAHTGRNAAVQLDLGYRFAPRGDDVHEGAANRNETHHRAVSKSPPGPLHSRHAARHGSPRTKSPLLVDPHAAREWAARVTIGAYRRDRTLAVTAFVDGALVDGPRPFDSTLGIALGNNLVSGAEVSIQWAGLLLAPSVALPLHRDARFQTRLQLRTEVRF